MPVMEHLIPSPYGGYVMDLLFDLAMWHAYAKLRMHTESTLSTFGKATRSLGQQLRKFMTKTSTRYATKETPKETAARYRHKVTRAAKKAKESSATYSTAPQRPSSPDNEPKKKIFNLFTYKAHALGDYLKTIPQFGTTDSYSTQIVSKMI